MSGRERTLFLVRFGLLLAIEALFCFTPLGSLPLGPMVATLAMLPVIIAGIILGPLAGTLMGLFAGCFSLIVWSFMPPNPLVAFVFSPIHSPGNVFSLIICILPRVLVGTVAGGMTRVLRRRKAWVRFGVPAVLASLTNTVLVLGGIAVFFGEAYAGALQTGLMALILTTVLTNGIPEAVVSFIVANAVCLPLKKDVERRR